MQQILDADRRILEKKSNKSNAEVRLKLKQDKEATQKAAAAAAAVKALVQAPKTTDDPTKPAKEALASQAEDDEPQVTVNDSAVDKSLFTPEMLAKTLFVGNLPVACIKKVPGDAATACRHPDTTSVG